MLNNEFPPLGGGTGTVNHAILRCLAQVSDLEIDLITSAMGVQFDQEQFADRITLFKVPVNNRNLHHSSNRELLTYAARALSFALKRHRSKPYDFCFAWSAVPAGGVALALRRLGGLRYLVRVCGPDIPGFEQRYGPLYPILKPTIKAVWHGAEVVVAKCEGEADMIRRVDRRVKVMLVPNGVDLAAFNPAPIDAGGPLRVLCVARLIERKGQRHLIEAVRRLVDEGLEVMLDLIGTGDALTANRRQADQLGVADRVAFVGYVPREDLAARYAAAHVFVLPSYNEGMSVATLEAMAAGLPVVATDIPGYAEVLRPGVEGLLVSPGNPTALAHALKRLLLDPGLAARLGAAGRARAKAFSWGEVVPRLEAVYERAVEASIHP